MNLLPNELWIEIFDYLEVKDLISLTETCKEFYSIIIETKFIEKFTLNLTSKCEEIKNERNYSQIAIKECNDLDKFIHIVKGLGENVKKISLIKLNLKASILCEICNLCPKVNQLLISEVNLIDDFDAAQFQLPNYENLCIYFEDSSPTIFKIFQNSSAVELILDNKCSTQHVDFYSLKIFLQQQKHLESLGLLYFSINTNLFVDNELDFVKFRLRKFFMNNVYLNSESVARFQTFLLNHIDNLECLHVQSPFLDVSFFKQFPVLKELKISHTNALFDTFENIEKLTVENVSGNWIEKFPNVKNIKLIYKYGVFLGMYSYLVNLLHLESVTIIDSKIPELNIPSVKELSLKNVTICAKRPFRYEDNQIKELHLNSCNTIEWLPDFIAQESTRMKILTISNISVNALIVKMIEGNRGKKIGLLKMINVN